MADGLAKRALKKERIEMHVSISKSEVKSIIWWGTIQKWQEMWDREKGRHLYLIQKSVMGVRMDDRYRREEVVLNRLRLGHCSLNKTLRLLGKQQTGLCKVCQEE